MNIILFDRNNHLLQFEADAGWAKDLLLSEDFLEPSGTKRQQKLDILNHMAKNPDEKSTEFAVWQAPGNVISVELSNKNSAKKLLANCLAPQQYHGMAIIDCVNKQLVSLNQSTLLNEFSFIEVEVQLDKQFDILNTATRISEYAKLLTKKYMTGPEEEKNLLISSIKKYLKNGRVSYHKNCLNKEKFTVDPTTTGWSTYSSTDYSLIDNYKKLNDILLVNDIVLTPKQEKSWQEFVDKQTRNNLTLDFFKTHRMEKEIEKEQSQLSQLVEELPMPPTTKLKPSTRKI